MRTNHCITIIPPYSLCKLSNTIISVVNCNDEEKYNNKYISSANITIPHQCCIPVIETEMNAAKNIDNNILGSNHILYTLHKIEQISIPIVECNLANLSYYGAKLITPEKPYFKLDNTSSMPLFNMTIGCDYVYNYLLQPGLGDGFYMEKHNTPHIHIPVDNSSCGHYILGNIIDENLYATAFQIPTGCAIYTPPNIYHCDAALVGNWNVMYACASQYITYIIHNNDNTIPTLKLT
jgi:hypothetical protein